MLVQLASDPGDEGGRHKNRGKNQSDANDGTRKFFHGFQRRVLRRHALLNVALHTFDNHDGVVHYKTDG